MSNDPQTVELLEMLREAREHANFLGELGVSSVEISIEPAVTTPTTGHGAASQNVQLSPRIHAAAAATGLQKNVAAHITRESLFEGPLQRHPEEPAGTARWYSKRTQE